MPPKVEKLTASRPHISIQTLLAGLAAPGLALLVLLPTLAFPFGRDQAVFAYVGEVIARGGMPYRDAWDLKPPGVYLAYAFLAALAPNGAALMTAVRLADLLVAAVTAWLLARLVMRLTEAEEEQAPRWLIGAAVAGWYAGLYLHGTYWSLAQAEAWANPFLLGGVLLLLGKPEERPRPVAAFVAGGLLGAVALLKFTAVLPALPVLGWVIWSTWRTERKPATAATLLALFGAGGALIVACGAGWLAVGGALDSYLDIQRGFVAPYARLGATGLGERLAGLFGHTLGWARLAWLPVGLAAFGLASKREWRAEGRGVAGATLFAGLLAVWWQGKYFGYHWQTALPWLALSAAVGTEVLAARLRLPRFLAATLLPMLALGWSVAAHWSDYAGAVQYASGTLTRKSWIQRFGRPRRGDYAFFATERAAAYVRKHTHPDEPVLVWGFEPAIYLLADRRPTTRFFFNVPVTVRFAPEAWRQEFLAAFDAHPPQMLVVLRNDPIPWATAREDDSSEQLAEWTELAERIRRNYREVGRREDFLFYQRQPTPLAPNNEQKDRNARTPGS